MSVTFYPAHYREDTRFGVVLDQVEETTHNHSVTLANSNAVRVLETLGLMAAGEDEDSDLFGQCEAEDFLGRILLALAIAPHDEEIPAHQLRTNELTGVLRTIVGDGGAKVWTGTRRAGYLQDKLQKLADLVRFCQQHDHMIAWA